MSAETTSSQPELLIQLRGVNNDEWLLVSRTNIGDIAKKSGQAFDHAMSTIETVAERTKQTIRSINISDQPDTVELTFGLKLTSDANALIASAGVEAQIVVKLVWNNKDKQSDSEDE